MALKTSSRPCSVVVMSTVMTTNINQMGIVMITGMAITTTIMTAHTRTTITTITTDCRSPVRP